jgi:UDP-glucose 4-epimerase
MGCPNFRFDHATVTDTVAMDRLISEAVVIVHLAAAVGVRLILERPVGTIETNVSGTEAVLRAARRYGCRVLIASTSEVYGRSDKVPLREEDDVVLGASDRSRWAYAASKMVDEFLGLAYHREYGLPVVVVRMFNVVGPRQTGRYGMVLPRFIEQALSGEPITVYGSGAQSRCFCDVQDVVPALMGLAEHPDAAGRVYNVGSTEEITIRELADRVKRITGSASPIIYVPYDQAYAAGFDDMPRRVPEITRIHSAIGWQPRRSLDEILNSIVAFERARRR